MQAFCAHKKAFNQHTAFSVKVLCILWLEINNDDQKFPYGTQKQERYRNCWTLFPLLKPNASYQSKVFINNKNKFPIPSVVVMPVFPFWKKVPEKLPGRPENSSFSKASWEERIVCNFWIIAKTISKAKRMFSGTTHKVKKNTTFDKYHVFSK